MDSKYHHPLIILPCHNGFNWKKRPLNRTTLHVTENFGQDQDAVDLTLIKYQPLRTIIRFGTFLNTEKTMSPLFSVIKRV